MKVDELREILKKYNSSDKDKIIVELYKRIPKDVKEDYNIDKYISDITKNEKTKKVEEKVTIGELKKEVEYFISCANDELYVRPNKVVSKNERSKWRFKVISFYKKLNTFDPTTEDGKTATNLLVSLYKLLSYASHYLTFSTWDTFNTIKVSQEDFLENIMKRRLANGYTDENIELCANLLSEEYDPQGYHRRVISSFNSCFGTDEQRYQAISAVEKELDKWKEKYNRKKEYKNEEYVNILTKCILELYIDLHEFDKGISFFHKNYIKSDSEIKEYVLLDELEDFDLFDEWIKEYEKHMDKIKYREILVEKYKEYKKQKRKNN